jgi:hypothetical protein
MTSPYAYRAQAARCLRHPHPDSSQRSPRLVWPHRRAAQAWQMRDFRRQISARHSGNNLPLTRQSRQHRRMAASRDSMAQLLLDTDDREFLVNR